MLAACLLKQLYHSAFLLVTNEVLTAPAFDTIKCSEVSLFWEVYVQWCLAVLRFLEDMRW